MKRLYKLRNIILLFLAVSLIGIITVNFSVAYAVQHSSGQTIRFGYIKNYGMGTKNNNEIYGYTYDYLMEIAKYTGWNYEFIECEGTELFEKLKNGEIDLAGPVQYSEERSNLFNYSKSEIYYGFTYLVTHNDTELYYEDFDAFDGINVGISQGNFYEELLNNYCKEKNFNINIVNSDGKDIENRLKNKYYDAFVITNLLYVPHVKVIAKLDTVPFYFLTSKNNRDIIDEIDKSMKIIFFEKPFLIAELHQKYYADITVAKPTYTKKEAEFIKSSKTYRVVADPDWAPFEQLDRASDIYSGIAIDILNEISDISGLKFEMIPTSNHKESVFMIKNGQADLLLGNTESTNLLGITHTDAYLEVPMILASLKPIDISKSLTVAMPSLESKICASTITRYPNFEYKDYGSTQRVGIALKNGREDLAFVDLYSFNENIRKESTQSYYTIPLDIYLPLDIAIAKDENLLLRTVLNTTIKCIDEERISLIIFENTVKNKYEVPLSTVLKENFTAIAVVFTVFLFCIAIIAVINKRKHKKIVENVANIDEITGLSTFMKFQKDVAKILKDAKPNQFMILSLDINNFKYINDTFGYAMGNKMLAEFGKQLLTEKTKTMAFCRISADNFILLIDNMPLDILINDFSTKKLMNGEFNKLFLSNYSISFCVGIYIVENPKMDMFMLIDNANLARKSIKGYQKNSFRVYDEEFEKLLKFNKEISMSMEYGITKKEFEVYLQPKFLINSNSIFGAEALVRWNHPKLGFIMPDKFISIFEKNGFIQKLDFYMFERTCELIKKWNEQNVEFGQISVNFSRYCMRYPNLVDVLIETAKRYNINPDRIEIELTESIAMNDLNLLINVMTKLRDAGFKISIDDFGSGYSSLNLLMRLPVDAIKIDREFLSDTYSSDAGKSMIQKIISMITSLNLETVAEGVETEEQLNCLKTFGCVLAQGFFFSKPLSIEEFEEKYINKKIKAQ